MVRLLAALAVPAVLLTTLAPAAPVPKVRPVYYFPTTVGDTFIVENIYKTITFRITNVDQVSEGYLVTYDWRSKPNDRPNNPERNDSRVGLKAFVTDRGLTFASPTATPSLKPPAKPGETWLGPYGDKYTTGKPEEITVKAGKFMAIPVTAEHPSLKDGTIRKYTEWYAPEVGIVKEVNERTKETIKELIEYKPAKANATGNNQP